MFRIGVDIGGTFTDISLIDDDTGSIFIEKVLTTDNPVIGCISGLRKVLQKRGGVKANQIKGIFHGTTLGINTILEKKGAKTGLIATKNFRDFLEIGVHKRFDLYDLFIDKADPIVPRYLRAEVTERTLYDGKILTPLDRSETESVIKGLLKFGIKSLAVCLLFSFRNAKHEEMVKEVAETIAPQLDVSLSSEISPEIREHERTSTVVLNAYISPKMKKYLHEFDAALRKEEMPAKLYVMGSHGGLMSVATTIRSPIRSIESGPAAATYGASFIAELMGIEDFISLDMGGTSTKACLQKHREAKVNRCYEIGKRARVEGSGYLLRIPVIDLVEIGAGGGSIARKEWGALEVGPQSAGSHPGPACYGMGGKEPTVTDANVILGYLNPDYFLRGEMKLDKELSIRAMREKICEPLEMDVTEAAWGIHLISNENMKQAIRAVSIMRGEDPRTFSLMAFGGAGPTHVCRLAKEIGISQVVVPFYPGVLSSWGLLTADVTFDFVSSYVSLLGQIDPEIVNKLYKEMESSSAKMIESARVGKSIRLVRTADMRYIGQGYEVEVPIQSGEFTKKDIEMLGKKFTKTYQNKYGYVCDGIPIETINWRLKVVDRTPKFTPTKLEKKIGTIDEALKEKRKAYFPEFEDYVEVEIYNRYKLYPGMVIDGPAIVEEGECTTVLIPDSKALVNDYGILTIDLDGK